MVASTEPTTDYWKIAMYNRTHAVQTHAVQGSTVIQMSINSKRDILQYIIHKNKWKKNYGYMKQLNELHGHDVEWK